MTQHNGNDRSGKKMGAFETIGEISRRLDYDVRDLQKAGYSVRQINAVLTGKYGIQELLQMKPEGRGYGRIGKFIYVAIIVFIILRFFLK